MCSNRMPAAQPGRRGRARVAARSAALGLAALLLAAGCAEPARPATKSAVLPVDGSPREVEMRLFVPPPAFPLSFTTYLPPDVHARMAPPGRSAALTFARAGEGEGADAAFVHLFVAPPDMSEPRARALVRAAAERFRVPGPGAEPRPAKIHAWAVEEYELRSRGTARDRLAWVALGRRQDRWFLLTVQVPVPLADSFGPRAERILEHWIWKDGEMPRRLAD